MTPKKSGLLANIGTNQTGQRKWDYGNVLSTTWRSDLLSQLFHTLIIIIIVGIWGRPGICKTCPRIKCLRLTLLQSNFDPSEFQKKFPRCYDDEDTQKGEKGKDYDYNGVKGTVHTDHHHKTKRKDNSF